MPVIRLKNESTTVPADRSASEIVKELVSIGATHIEMNYVQGRVSGLKWAMPVGGSSAHFAMPVRVDGVFDLLLKRQQGAVGPQRRAEIREKAERIAWRHLLRWTQAQAAIIQTSMMAPAEPFFSFTVVPGTAGGKRLFEQFEEAGRLEASKPQ